MPSSVADRGPFDRVGVVEVAPRRGAGHRPFHGGGQGRCDILVHRPPRHGAGRGRIGARRCGDCRGLPGPLWPGIVASAATRRRRSCGTTERVHGAVDLIAAQTDEAGAGAVSA